MVDRRRDPGQGEGRRRRLTRLRLGILVVTVGVIVSSVVLAVSYSGSSPTIPVLNIPVPRVDLANVVPGAPNISMASLRGRAVVVNFWGSWCPPCVKEMPILQAAHRKLGNRVIFVGIDEEDTRQAAISFLHSVGVTYSNGFDANGSVGRSFVIEGTPTTYFISNGRELDYTPGELTQASLSTNLRALFGVS